MGLRFVTDLTLVVAVSVLITADAQDRRVGIIRDSSRRAPAIGYVSLTHLAPPGGLLFAAGLALSGPGFAIGPRLQRE